MPIILQALPLSLATFWRYLILLPFLGVGAMVLSLAGFIPILGLVVPGMVSALMTIVGLRCALAARGHRSPPDMGHLLTISLIYGVILIATGVFAGVAQRGIVLALTYTGVAFDAVGLLRGVFGLSYYWASVLLALLSPKAIVVAALAVPMTGAAAASRHRADPGYLSGLGSGLISLLIVMAVWLFCGHVFALVGEVWTGLFLIVTTLLELYDGEDWAWPLRIHPRSLLGSTLLMAWASSWFFSTAVLCWERRVAREEAQRRAQTEAERVPSTDIRALRQARMRR